MVLGVIENRKSNEKQSLYIYLRLLLILMLVCSTAPLAYLVILAQTTHPTNIPQAKEEQTVNPIQEDHASEIKKSLDECNSKLLDKKNELKSFDKRCNEKATGTLNELKAQLDDCKKSAKNDHKLLQKDLEECNQKSKEHNEVDDTSQKTEVKSVSSCAPETVSALKPIDGTPCAVEHFASMKRTYELGNPEVRRYLKENPIHLVVQSYHSNDKWRDMEIMGCLQANLAQPYIEKVHFLSEDPDLTIADFNDFLYHDKLVFHVIGHRIDASEAMQYANTHIEEGVVIVLANADVYFDDTIRYMTHLKHKSKPHAYFLSRRRTYHTNKETRELEWSAAKDATNTRDHCEQYGGSHDVFAWVNPVPESLIQTCDFELGTAGFENRYIFEFESHGYSVLNPCKVIIARHIQGDYGVESGPHPPKNQERKNDRGRSRSCPPTSKL